MDLTHLGAETSVTGSCHLLRVNGLAILVDCGLAQGSEAVLPMDDWPVAPGDRRTVEVARHDVYAPDARIVAIGAGGESEVPRSRLLFFWGAAVGDPSRRVLVSLHPDTDVYVARIDGTSVLK